MTKKIASIFFALLMVISPLGKALAEDDTYTLTVDDSLVLTVDGVEITDTTISVSKSAEVKIVPPTEDVILIQTENGYYEVNTNLNLTEDTVFENAISCTLGLEMVDGAQVRIGTEPLPEGAKLDALADSGLRFIATANYTDSVIADENVEFGIKIMADASDKEVYIKAEKFQDEDRTVFTGAITGMEPANYLRKYMACAYAKVVLHDGTEKEFVTSSVTRSIYQVSVGIMKNSSAEAEDNVPYSVDAVVKNVLNAYINQAGIRLNYNLDGSVTARSEGKGSYSGDLFFDVASSLNPDGSTHVTVTPLGQSEGFGNSVTIASWWNEYIRINNNNSEAVTYISGSKIEDGVLSFDFTVPDYKPYSFNQEDSVTVVASISDKEITGFKAGEEISYQLTDNVAVFGLSDSIADVVPGSVVLIGESADGEKCAAIELLATLGMPIDSTVFESSFGVYDPSDGSQKYKNVVTEMSGKSGTKITTQNLPDTTKTVYYFEGSSMCYRVGIAMEGETPIVTTKGDKVSTYPSIFESTAKYHNYLYLRYNTETGKVKEAVFYCVPKDLDFSGDGEYSDIYSLRRRVIIE